jgi:hypothetical protein
MALAQLVYNNDTAAQVRFVGQLCRWARSRYHQLIVTQTVTCKRGQSLPKHSTSSELKSHRVRSRQSGIADFGIMPCRRLTSTA